MIVSILQLMTIPFGKSVGGRGGENPNSECREPDNQGITRIHEGDALPEQGRSAVARLSHAGAAAARRQEVESQPKAEKQRSRPSRPPSRSKLCPKRRSQWPKRSWPSQRPRRPLKRRWSRPQSRRRRRRRRPRPCPSRESSRSPRRLRPRQRSSRLQSRPPRPQPNPRQYPPKPSSPMARPDDVAAAEGFDTRVEQLLTLALALGHWPRARSMQACARAWP